MQETESREAVTDADVIAALERAADILDTEGWCRGQAHNEKTGHRCALGALSAATHTTSLYRRSEEDLWYTARGLLAEAITDDLGGASDGGIITAWNDAQTDKRVITRRLRRVARQLRA